MEDPPQAVYNATARCGSVVSSFVKYTALSHTTAVETLVGQSAAVGNNIIRGGNVL